MHRRALWTIVFGAMLASFASPTTAGAAEVVPDDAALQALAVGTVAGGLPFGIIFSDGPTGVPYVSIGITREYCDTATDEWVRIHANDVHSLDEPGVVVSVIGDDLWWAVAKADFVLDREEQRTPDCDAPRQDETRSRRLTPIRASAGVLLKGVGPLLDNGSVLSRAATATVVLWVGGQNAKPTVTEARMDAYI
jgi:hypothetical protein